MDVSFVSRTCPTVTTSTYLIKVGASPLQKTLVPSFFQLRTIVEMVTPPPWKNPLLACEAEVV